MSMVPLPRFCFPSTEQNAFVCPQLLDLRADSPWNTSPAPLGFLFRSFVNRSRRDSAGRWCRDKERKKPRQGERPRQSRRRELSELLCHRPLFQTSALLSQFRADRHPGRSLTPMKFKKVLRVGLLAALFNGQFQQPIRQF